MKQVRKSAVRELRWHQFHFNVSFHHLFPYIDQDLLHDLMFDFINTKVKSVIYKLDIAMQYKFKKNHLFKQVGQARKKLVGSINWIKHEISILFQTFVLKQDEIEVNSEQNLSNNKNNGKVSRVHPKTLRNRKHRQRYALRKKNANGKAKNTNAKKNENKSNKYEKKIKKSKNSANITSINNPRHENKRKRNSNKKQDIVKQERDDRNDETKEDMKDERKDDIHVVNHNVIQNTSTQNNGTSISVPSTSSVSKETTKNKYTHDRTTSEMILRKLNTVEASEARSMIDSLSQQQILQICIKLGIDTGGTARLRKIGILRYYGIT